MGVGGSVRAAAALAFAVALRMRAAGRGGSEDEEEVVDAGWAVMRAGLRAAASAAATAGRMEGISSVLVSATRRAPLPGALRPAVVWSAAPLAAACPSPAAVACPVRPRAV